ncbi:hypothetical protein TNCV_2723061 [Trichonephila clavipes]|nr:hypothetical protein TNCV_2723061 [Trichonephila clavipes]
MTPERLDSIGSTTGVKILSTELRAVKERLEVIVCPNKSLPTMSHLVLSPYASRQQMPDWTTSLASFTRVCAGHQH